ncbi:hypothetical protein [Breznakiella homolactica]|uniref:DUF2191 domain-containing protein n=1 Tax=Breznakiella homolactica TaxID=2798577 RepID=A0A7T8B9X5_9SPIR|nr:hypothetical protein [Breznakiella homolactica]QQO07638.1 hypothetical protein JFL75_11840 [Breznakiella homolactica]
MKVTAIIEDSLINEVKTASNSSTITEAITMALRDWLDLYHIKELNKEIAKKPITIESGRTIRELNRKS